MTVFEVVDNLHNADVGADHTGNQASSEYEGVLDTPVDED